LVSYNDRVGIGATLVEALAKALGVDASSEPDDPAVPGAGTQPDDDPNTPQGTVEEQIGLLLAQAQELFDEADEALNATPPDLGTYQDKANEARDKIEDPRAPAHRP